MLSAAKHLASNVEATPETAMFTIRKITVLLIAFALLPQLSRAQSHDPQQLIQTLQSTSASKPDKALACKYLAIYGNADAVPALAALLPDKELSSWARIPLEAIPGPAPDDALRDALNKLEGRLLTGVINSLGVRRDSKSTDPLAQKLDDPDKDVAAAAAVSLGKIAGDRAIAVLEKTLAHKEPAVRSAAGEGLVLCAERLMNDGNKDRAAQLYDAVRKSDVLKQRILEATRGAILARGPAGVPLLVEQLRSSDKPSFLIALRTARELPGGDATQAIVAELGKAPPERQGLIILALADRPDAKSVLNVVHGALASGPPNVKVVAATVLEQLGDASSVTPLVEAAAAEDAGLAAAAKTSLARMPGKDIDANLFARLQDSSGRMRQVLIELAEQRKLQGALPVFMKSAEDQDPGVRTAALVAIGAIGDDKQMPDLIKLLPRAIDPEHRNLIERAILSISGRWGKASVPHLLPLAREGDTPTRVAAMRALVGCGGAEALSAIVSALSDNDQTIQDEAVRALSTWPNRWPDDAAVTQPLLNLAKSAQKPQHRVLALRGYFQHVQGAKRLSTQDRLAKVNEVLPLCTRPEEKRLAISALGAIATPAAVEHLITLANDDAVAEEACSALVTLVTKNEQALPKDLRKKALQIVTEKSKNEPLKTKAQQTLNNIK
jgi:HEAT repeat protein